MPAPDLLYLTQREVIELAPTPAEAIELVSAVLAEHGAGRYENPPKPGIHPQPDSFLHAMPGYLPARGIGGMKWVGGFFENPARGLPSISGLIVLNDVQSGLPIAVMDCAYITALRTAAVSGVAARHLARPGARTIGIVGAGVQGRYNLLTIKATLPQLALARVFDLNAETLARFVAEMPALADVEVTPADSIDAALGHADILLTATGQLHEVLFAERLAGPGALVLPVHSAGWQRDVLVRMDRFIVDDWAQFRATAERDGLYAPLPEPHAQLGQVVAGLAPGRERDDERIINFNYGIAIQDVAMGSEVLTRARERGVGTLLPQLDGVMPFT